MGYGGNILDQSDPESGRLQGTDSGFPPRTGAFNKYAQILDPMIHRLVGGVSGSLLGGERSGFA